MTPYREDIAEAAQSSDGARGSVVAREPHTLDLFSRPTGAYIRHGERAGVLYCVECGCCSGELGKGWAAFMCDDPDGVDKPHIVVYCPPCAAAEFGYRPDVAATYVCAWEPLPSKTAEGS